MTSIKIEYWDNGKVAREKINAIIDEVLASIPSIWENGNRYIGGVDTWICAIGVRLREENNLIHRWANEITYVDLQFQDWLTPTSDFPIWVTVWNVSSSDNRPESWMLLNNRTNTTYARMLYWDSWALYFDWGLWIFKRIATTDYVDNALSQLRNELHTVAFTGKSSDLNNDYWFSAVPIMTKEQYDDIPWTAWDDKEYFIFESITN